VSTPPRHRRAREFNSPKNEGDCGCRRKKGVRGHHPVTLRGAIDADRSQESTTGRTPTGRKPETPEGRPQTPVTPYEVSRLSRHVSEIV
jgi:hypothetical protein